MPLSTITVIKAAVIYFAAVFGVGFVFGTIRVLFIVPQIGARLAELGESPLMLVATIVLSRWVSRKFCQGFGKLKLLGVGLIAVILLLTAELIVGVGLRGISLVQVFTERDPVSAVVYYGLLGLFAFMPWFFGNKKAQALNDTA